MPDCKIFISFLFLLFSFFFCQGQDSNKYVYQDSSLLTSDTTVKIESTQRNDTNISAAPDTTLVFNNIQLSDDSIEAFKSSSSFAYAKNLDSLLKVWQKENQGKVDSPEKSIGWLDAFFTSAITKLFFWSLAIFFVLFILYNLLFTKGAFRKNITAKQTGDKADTIVDDTLNYDKLVAQAIHNKDYRMAVRYLYLQSLQKLSANNLIQLAADKTNYRYVTELNGTMYKDDFLWLTLSYEYVWYGKYEPDDTMFAQLQNNFNQFNSRL